MAKQTETLKTKRRLYSNNDTRATKVNKMTLNIVTLIELLLIFALLVQSTKKGDAYLMLTEVNTLVAFYAVPILMTCILYYDIKFFRISCGTTLLITFMRTMLWTFNGHLAKDQSAFISCILCMIILIVIYITSATEVEARSQKNRDDAEHAKTVLTDILNEIQTLEKYNN